MSCNVAEYVVGWLYFVAYKLVKMVDLSQVVLYWSANYAYKCMDTHTHTPTITIGVNAMRCISAKNFDIKLKNSSFV